MGPNAIKKFLLKKTKLKIYSLRVPHYIEPAYVKQIVKRFQLKRVTVMCDLIYNKLMCCEIQIDNLC
jgi:hypothetical protein